MGEVADRIETKCADFFDYAQGCLGGDGRLAVEGYDAVFLSPPWGGVDYLKLSTSSPADSKSAASQAARYDYYPLQSICAPHGLEKMIKCASKLDRNEQNNIVLFLPRNTSLCDLFDLAQRALRATDNADDDDDDAGALSQHFLPMSFSSVKDSRQNANVSERKMDVEEQWMGWKLKGITAYLGRLASSWEEPFREDYGWFEHQE
ncbi:Methylase [Ceraceosorus bombacis]|uniref:Trimethylguanosine synthase n=1 Tax=Ceraceosorus bombacis TaxID=401625 RepID=A0A0P1BEI3_9BASI|nr:Methylase [Ceraceosorus bombacis]